LRESRFRELADRAAAIGRRDDRIVAVLVYGSHAAGTADEHSDLDLGIVTTDDGFDSLVADAPLFVEGLGRALFIDHFGNPAQIHAILDDGTGLELIIDRAGKIAPEMPHAVLVDKEHVVPRATPARPPVDDRHEDVRRLVTWFWHDVDHVITALGRGQHWWAYGQLEELRGVVIGLARVAAGADADQDDPYWKIDSVLPEERLSALGATVAPLELRPMRQAALAAIALHRELAGPIAKAHGVVYPAELDRLLTRRLEELKLPR
jgi:lincosamide nucleotidyltransferase